jgi:hypothetical protein
VGHPYDGLGKPTAVVAGQVRTKKTEGGGGGMGTLLFNNDFIRNVKLNIGRAHSPLRALKKGAARGDGIAEVRDLNPRRLAEGGSGARRGSNRAKIALRSPRVCPLRLTSTSTSSCQRQNYTSPPSTSAMACAASAGAAMGERSTNLSAKATIFWRDEYFNKYLFVYFLYFAP